MAAGAKEMKPEKEALKSLCDSGIVHWMDTHADAGAAGAEDESGEERGSGEHGDGGERRSEG